MTDTDERLTRVETKLDVLADQWEKRFTSLETRMTWLMGLMTTWLTIMIGVAIAVLKR